MTRPLTDQEHRVLADSDFMQAILKKLNERKALRKPQLLMDLFYPDRRDSISRRKGEFQYKEESSEDSPWEDDQETDQKDKNKGSGGPRAFNENE